MYYKFARDMSGYEMPVDKMPLDEMPLDKMV